LKWPQKKRKNYTTNNRTVLGGGILYNRAKIRIYGEFSK
jgi:hypothetical protein